MVAILVRVSVTGLRVRAENQRGCWLGLFTRTKRELCRLNEDYAAHRVGDLTMLKPEVRAVPPGKFEAWIASRVKKDDIIQAKVPRMDNTGTITGELAKWVGS